MEIAEIKSKLTLSEVLQHYGLKPDKHLRLNCPFHEDKTPSLQVYYKTHTAYCFSSNCSTHGKSLDVIDFVMHMEKSNKHEAIKKAESLLSGGPNPSKELSRTAVLTKLFIYFKNAVHNSPQAKEYLQSRNLDFGKIEVGYNAGQFHHGTRKEENLIKSCLAVGLLIDKNLTSRTGEKAYQSFGKNCIVFSLKNKQNQVISLYFRSTTNNSDQRHFYLKDRQGLYPGYPKQDTKKLILTESIIDAATLLQEESFKDYTILSLYGTNGLTEEHIHSIKDLNELDEIVFFLNGDEAGRAATVKHTLTLQAIKPGIKITHVNVPQGEDVNSLVRSHDKAILAHLINNRTAFIFSNENILIENSSVEKEKLSESPSQTPAFNTSNPHNIVYSGLAAVYSIKGGIRNQLDNLKVSLQMMHFETKQDYRCKLDLYEYKQVENIARSAVEKLNLRSDLIEKDLSMLTNLLEGYRAEALVNKSESTKTEIKINEATTRECIAFLKQPDLLKRLNALIGKSVVGEEESRIFLFVIASSYKMADNPTCLGTGEQRKRQDPFDY